MWWCIAVALPNGITPGAPAEALVVCWACFSSFGGESLSAQPDGGEGLVITQRAIAARRGLKKRGANVRVDGQIPDYKAPVPDERATYRKVHIH